MSYYVTTPIYYVNAEPHLGHAYTTIAADVLARHMRQRGEDVFFLTGTDEHGEPVAQAAEKLGHHAARAGRPERRPVQGARRAGQRDQRLLHPHHRSRAHGAGRRGRPADPRQRPRLRRAPTRAGTARAAPTSRPRPSSRTATAARSTRSCSSARRRTTGSSGCPPSRSRSSSCTPSGPTSSRRRTATTRRSRSSRAACATCRSRRARLKWGVPVPWDESQVIYVWIDALLNYYTALSYARPGEDLTDRFWPADRPPDRQGHPQVPRRDLAGDADGGRRSRCPRRSRIHGYLLIGEHKMSKSLGNVIEPFQVVDMYGADALRFYVLREVSFGADGEVSPEGFETRYTTELANEYGNLASRTLAMIERYRDGVVPRRARRRTAGRRVRRARGRGRRLASTRSSSPPRSTRSGSAIKRLNRYVQDEEPWQLAKDDARGRPPRPGALHARRGTARGVGAAAPVHARTRRSGCSPRSGARTSRSTARALGAAEGGARVGELGPALPAGRGRGAGRLRPSR